MADMTSINYFRLHVKAVHDKVKDERCPHCDYLTAQRCNLRKHIKLVHGETNKRDTAL